MNDNTFELPHRWGQKHSRALELWSEEWWEVLLCPRYLAYHSHLPRHNQPRYGCSQDVSKVMRMRTPRGLIDCGLVLIHSYGEMHARHLLMLSCLHLRCYGGKDPFSSVVFVVDKTMLRNNAGSSFPEDVSVLAPPHPWEAGGNGILASWEPG